MPATPAASFAAISFAALLFAGSAAAADPIADRAAAQALVEADDWAAAASAYDTLVARDPYHGADWYHLGLARARLGDCAAAEPALARAVALGVNGGESGMRAAHREAAGCAAEEGRFDDALAHLSLAQARFEFDDWDGLAEDARFDALRATDGYKYLSGEAVPADIDRAAGWRADLDYFVDLVERRHPDPFHTADEAEWRAAVGELSDAIPLMTDVKIVGGFMRLASRIRDGHTTVYPPFEGDRAFHLTPVWTYAFPDGWRILAAAPGLDDLVGARVVSVNGVPMQEAARRIADHLPRDNEQTPKWLVNLALQFSEIGAASLGGDELVLEIEDGNGAVRAVTLEPGPINRNPNAAWAPADWPTAAAAAPPLWLSQTETPHWFADLDDVGAVYAQVNQMRNAEDRTLEDFAKELVRHVDEKGASRLILDLRHNNGGNGYFAWPLVREITRSRALDHDNGFFVITGRRTFSAAMILSSMLETHTGAIFVGEPTGSRPNFYGEDAQFRLPYSGLQGSISSRWFQGGRTSNDLRPWIAPDLFAELTFDDVKEGRDPALEAIRAHLTNRN